MFCNYCRAINPNDAVYCSACGQTIKVPVEGIGLKESPETASTSTSHNNSSGPGPGEAIAEAERSGFSAEELEKLTDDELDQLWSAYSTIQVLPGPALQDELRKRAFRRSDSSPSQANRVAMSNTAQQLQTPEVQISPSGAENTKHEETRAMRPESMPHDGDLFRNGKDLIVRRGAKLPTICLKCGRPATGFIKKKIYWHPSWLLALVLLGLWPYFIAVLVMRKSMGLNLPLCEAHRKRHRLLQILSAAALVVGLFLLVLSFYSSTDEAPAIAGIGALFLLLGLISWAVKNMLLTATSIGDEFGVFRGASATFLERIPAKPDSVPT